MVANTYERYAGPETLGPEVPGCCLRFKNANSSRELQTLKRGWMVYGVPRPEVRMVYSPKSLFLSNLIHLKFTDLFMVYSTKFR